MDDPAAASAVLEIAPLSPDPVSLTNERPTPTFRCFTPHIPFIHISLSTRAQSVHQLL
jgi:hypothetical protein